MTQPLVMLLLVPMLVGCNSRGEAKSAKTEKPATLVQPPDETNLLVVQLTPKAEQRLGITIAPVARQTVHRRRSYGGVVTIPPGRAIIVSAPLTGTLAAPDGGNVPTPGTVIQAGQPVFKFVPLLSPERYVPSPAERVQMANAQAGLVSSQLLAEGDVKRGRAEVDAAKIALDRAQQLLRDGAGSQKAVDEADAAKTVAERTLEAALKRKELLDQLSLDSESGTAKPIEIAAPETGVLRNLSSARGQTVSTGEALFEIVNLDTVWVRVPVYVGELDDLDVRADASVASLDKDEGSAVTAAAVAAPPTADAISSTADLYYSLANSDGKLRPGERLSVSVLLRGEVESLVVPAAAILHDVDGGTWVYVKTGEQEFRRRRVSLRFLTGDSAVLAEGPDVGTQVVVHGAVELFGTEFGIAK